MGLIWLQSVTEAYNQRKSETFLIQGFRYNLKPDGGEQGAKFKTKD
jgi:hypothetical protein